MNDFLWADRVRRASGCRDETIRRNLNAQVRKFRRKKKQKKKFKTEPAWSRAKRTLKKKKKKSRQRSQTELRQRNNNMFTQKRYETSAER